MFLNESLAGHYDLHNFTKTRGTNLPAHLSSASRNCFPVPSQPQSVQNSRLRRAVFPPYGKSFRPKVAYGKSFRPDTPHPRRGASVELSEGESDPSQTYVSPFRIPVSPMVNPPLLRNFELS